MIGLLFMLTNSALASCLYGARVCGTMPLNIPLLIGINKIEAYYAHYDALNRGLCAYETFERRTFEIAMFNGITLLPILDGDLALLL